MATLVNTGPDVAPAPKQIRFVNNQGQPPTKRRRINAACLTCRKRKTRCAGEHPTCSTCSKNGHACLGYSDGGDKKRDAVASHGSVADPAQIEPDDEEFLDEEPDVERARRQSKVSIKNEAKPFVNADDASVSGPLSDRAPGYATLAAPSKSENMDWEDQHSQVSQSTPRPETASRRPTTARNSSFSTEEGRSPSSRSPMLQRDESHRVPYFRYFGPTAIVPGFKQMVVKLRDKRRGSLSATSPSTGSVYAGLLTTMQPDPEIGHIEDMPVYDPNDTAAVHPLILNLIETFFLRLGSNFPFLRRHKFSTMVKEKRVEPILVDAVCALAARFSDVSVFRRWNDGNLAKSEYGNVFAQRAKAATVDTFPCPSVAAVQACLLMAYEAFGADQDSALWMYLGVSIRAAMDLGLSKEDGVKYRGAQDPWYTRSADNQASEDLNLEPARTPAGDTLGPDEQKELEQERIDTFWAVFFLDRAISSGTGRPVTLKDDDYELPFPKTSIQSTSGWPDPNASLLRIVHLYGRVADVLNNIKHPKDLTKDKLNRLVQMENELTKLHQQMEPRLRFDANNFQAHVKNGQGTTFILLHFWFHALIIVLHQPTLLTEKGTLDRKHQLKHHSRELSMSSAKTITDILAFAELLDPKCFIGNPFTSQPIYIAACAFLMESRATASHPPSRNTSPPQDTSNSGARKGFGPATGADPDAAKHALLASAANQNYQLCYKALKQMHTYWGGVRYILTVLDHKSQGQWDCETFTSEEYESTKRTRRDSSVQGFASRVDIAASPLPDNGPPLAWSLTGTTNSPNSSLTLLFQNPVAGGGLVPHQHNHQHHQQQQAMPSPQQNTATSLPGSGGTPPGNMIYDPIRQSLPETTTSMYPPAYPQPHTSDLRSRSAHSRRISGASVLPKSQLRYEGFVPDDAMKTPSTPDSKMSMTMSGQASSSASGLAYTPSSQQSAGFEQSGFPTAASPTSTQSIAFGANSHPASGNTAFSDSDPSNFTHSGNGLASSNYSYMGPAGPNLHLLTYDNETDIGHHLTSFEHTEMMSWFGDYFPNDVLGLYPGDTTMG
ncbi:fungal-specific transcription factor domain-containing protein [Xylariomycetidae sp. FL0641]|nr:fungal-specific transcription factor domain-containing protein [Xylariomycetidae sp. FL0641]